ncbi:dTDP-4-dehydrorhamnose 3,5-epimerase [Ferdinandcohnia quinoae]|uniref:dTDP-4-dehydrorhamnose 3,5-epimerase n=1 Tax=Fredinandcohnia quinoae TaxID=2918902 RepID=A0AAW5DYA0_9BACI|nr:dTDP-4-dehydrorhamnose 3,5-epimerase [Fredinandcohnia sp. SECRCQ15]MCH1625063.1 dTDP-4-dehydrorhamnose 3,5-epimerase [Fredinandcohnia sp. SECRCQ15]
MNVIHSKFPGVKLLEPNAHVDHRGYFMESFNESIFQDIGFNQKFVQDNQSLSKDPGTIRGLHYQLNPKSQAKLVRVLSGVIYDVVVDIRKNSPTFGQWEGYILSEYNLRQLLIPKGFAHGFCTLVPDTQIYYKVDEFYSAEHDRGILWNDPEMNITWPVSNPILSNKDERLPLLKYAELNF